MGYVLQELAKYFKAKHRAQMNSMEEKAASQINDEFRYFLLGLDKPFMVAEIEGELKELDEDFYNNQRITNTLTKYKNLGAVEIVGKERSPKHRGLVNLYQVNHKVLERTELEPQKPYTCTNCQ